MDSGKDREHLLALKGICVVLQTIRYAFLLDIDIL